VDLAFGSLTRTTVHTCTDRAPAGRLELDLADPAQRHMGDYELHELLGEGGMGVVYRARQVSLDREVAIKLLSAGPWASRDFIARFEREARNAARMQHPNIVTVYEVGSLEGLPFFSMRLVRGESLASRLRHGATFTPRTAAALMRTVAEAVGYAHSLGVLHLDLKPANVLVDEAGTPFVADFGLARRLESTLAAVENEEVSGTPAYMAPEQAQARGSGLTAATDIWGLGAILYELLAGQPPFCADTPRATLKLVLDGKVRSPRRHQPTLPLDMEAIVLRCLARSPDARYSSARALAGDLARFVEGRPVQARPLNGLQRAVRWARREPRLAVTAMLAFGILVAGLIAATAQWRRAEAGAGAARDNLWTTRAEAAQQALAGGDGFRGLHPLVANLAEMEAVGRSDQAAIERQRIGTILANAPQLAGLVRVPAQTISAIAVAPDGRRFAVATFDWFNGPERYVRQYQMDSLRQTWVASTRNRTFQMGPGGSGGPHSNLHYSADGRYLLMSLEELPVMPAPRTSDMVALDARDGRVLWPKALREPPADVVYDDALNHALVRYRSDRSLRWPDSAQFYEVDGWRPVGPRHTRATTLAADFWLPAPDGRTWLGTRDCVSFALYDVPGLEARWHLRLPRASIVRAWALSHRGHWLALGSVDGTVRLANVADGHAIVLASGPAERVTRVEFSADDRTLAAIDEGGQLWSWDVASHVPRAAPLHFVRNERGALIRFAGDTLFGGGVLLNGGKAEIAYATLTPRAPFNNELAQGAARLHVVTQFGGAFDASASAHRLVVASSDVTVSVWRLPPSPLLEARAAPLQPLVQTFDSKRVVVVDGATARVIDVATGRPRSPPLRHPEPVRFAELAPDDRSLVTIAGRTVRVIDPVTWRLRGVPIVLPQTPERVAFAQAAPVIVITTSAYEGDARRTVVHRIDLVHGTVLGRPMHFEDLGHFEIDARGRYALVESRTHPTAIMRIALDKRATPCAPKLGDVWKDAFSPDGHSAWIAATEKEGPLLLRRLDLGACRELALAGKMVLETAAVLVQQGHQLIVHRNDTGALLRVDARGRLISAVGEANPGLMYDLALSADGGRAALATRNALYIIEPRQGQRLSAPLAAPIAGDDAIARLAFSPDGTRLIARTINQRWLFWELPRTDVGSADLARLVRALDPRPGNLRSDSDIRAIDARLHGAAAPPSVPTVSNVPVVFAPAPGARVDPRFVPLDLANAINMPLVGMAWPEPFARYDQPMLAPGLQRFLGIDYRVDGGVQLSGGGAAVALYLPHRQSPVVPVPGVRARRVHVLAFMQVPMARGTPPGIFGYVVLIGADGRETRLGIRTVRDVVTDEYDPETAATTARVAFVEPHGADVRMGDDPMQPESATYGVALDVPPGTGAIRGLRFDVGPGPMEAPLFYAATLERADGGPVGKSTPR
jgi:hypothetical protein